MQTNASHSGGLFTAWVLFMSWLVKGQTEGKMFSGYPCPEHTTAIGTFIIGFFSFVIMIAIFVLSI